MAYRPSALPSATARVLAFAAILIGGLCGALIGYSIADLQCGESDRPPAEAEAGADHDGGCGAVVGAGAFGGAVVGAGGVAVISVLVLRAMAEWRREVDSPQQP